ncbi:MAG: tetratricopeptide repeat protein [Sideroxydans sp.]|nr:tetratricopeptide repeat protein [Sideroxydans sp.]
MNTNKSHPLLSRAFLLHQAGRLDEAETAYRTILEEEARNPQVLSMLGMLQMQRGDWEGGVLTLNASLEIEPGQPDALNNLGYALQTLSRDEEALACYDQAIALLPSHVSACYNRGNILQNLGRYQDAIDSFQKALSLRPHHADSHVNLGNAFARLGRHDEALTSYIKALNLSPADPGIANNLGLALKALKRYKEAQAYFNKAIALQPNYVDAHFNLAIALQDMGHNEEARAEFGRAIALHPAHADAHVRLGQVLQSLQHHAEALASYQVALSIRPDDAGTHVSLGVLHMELGNSEEATNCFLRAIEADQQCSAAYLNLATQNHYARDEALFTQLQSLYARRTTLPANERIDVSFAMGEALEKMGRYEESFAAFAEGNQLRCVDNPVDEVVMETLFDKTTTLFTRELFGECQALSSILPSSHEERVPVFIVGMPRSGTTLIEQILASHPAVFGAGELDDIGEVVQQAGVILRDSPDMETSLLRLRDMGREYMDRVWKRAPDARYITDKMPGNFRYLGLIHLMLPNAKIIHSMRDPLDSCFSCYALSFKDGHEYSYDLEMLGRHYQRYQRLMAHWHSVLPAGKILDVRYEDIVADLEGQTRRLLEYVDLPWDPACLNFHENKRTVSTASVAQVRKPIYSSSVARWKNFEKHLGPLLEIVGTQHS